jgi:hypothetical protein
MPRFAGGGNNGDSYRKYLEITAGNDLFVSDLPEH